MGTGNSSGENGADLVVYGKIFTSENGQIAEAFAIKDGRYIYVVTGREPKHLLRRAGLKLLTIPARDL